MGDISFVDVVVRFAVAVALGALIGFEREARNKTAGLRTHALVAVGAALFTMAGAYGFADHPSTDVTDPTRIAAQVASGIGFIGAGAIIRNGRSVQGVTTAATLWAAAAIGVGAGSGFVVGTAVATAIVLLVLLAFGLASRLLQRVTPTSVELSITYERGHGTLGPLLHAIEEHGEVESIRIRDEGDASAPGDRTVSVEVSTPHSQAVTELLEDLRAHPEIGAVDVRS